MKHSLTLRSSAPFTSAPFSFRSRFLNRPGSQQRPSHLAVTLAGLALFTYGVTNIEAQPTGAAVETAGSAQSASASQRPPLAVQFMYLDASPSGTQLVTPDGSVGVGLPDDQFAALLQFSHIDAIVAGTRPTDHGPKLILVESRLGPHGTRLQNEIPGPQALSRRPQSSPRLFPAVDDQARLSAAWFEGDDPTHNEIWTADLTAEGFTRPRRLATEGPGSQVALQGTTLANGEQVLVWSAFDGEDSEVVWVHRRPAVQDNGGWTQPQRLYANNAVPDITPAIVAVDGQALAVWSRFDGETYRLMRSQFNGTKWSTPTYLSVDAGIFPRFKQAPWRQSGPTILSYRAAAPKRWVYQQLDLSGDIVGQVNVGQAIVGQAIVGQVSVGQVVVHSGQSERPTVLAANSSALVLALPIHQPNTQGLVAATSEAKSTQPAALTQTLLWQQP